MKPNAPRMVTVLVAVLLTAAGLALVALPSSQIDELLRQLPLGDDLTRQLMAWGSERATAWVLLVASPVLLIVGSLVRGL
jgi:hypothetical protein